MSNLSISFSPNVMNAYKQLITVPFYKTDDENIYRFASHIFDNTDNTTGKTALQSILHNEPKDMYKDVLPIFQKAVKSLSEHIILASDLLAWNTYRKAKGTVLEYQTILASIYHELLIHEIHDELNGYVNSHSDFFKQMEPYDIPFDTENTQEQHDNEYVLNHNNPFADVSIQNQQFIYSSDSDQFGTLSLNTSHTVTRVEHDEDTSYLVMQPGFKIKTTNTVRLSSPQEVIFDDELTSEIVQQDNKIYVYIN